jgi:hypothetical protein
MFCLFLGTLVVLGEEPSSLGIYANHMDSSVQRRALETMVDLGEASIDDLTMGWSSSEIHTRERLADSLYRTNHIEGLNLAWSVELSEQERCRLALRLSTLGYAEDMIAAASAPIGSGPSWPVFSKGTLEDKWTCAIASATLLAVDAPLRPLLERGDFPFSMPFVWDVYNFATADTVQRLYDEIEWVEEGLRAPLWTAIRLHTSGVDDVDNRYQEQIEQWSVGECLDATEMAWSIGLRYPKRKKDVLGVLSQLQTHSALCKEWVRLSRASLQNKLPRAILKNATDIRADKDDVLGALRLVSTQPHLNKRQIRKVKRYLLPLLQKDLETTIWIEYLRGLYVWFDPSDTEAMALLNDIERKTTEASLLVEVAIAQKMLDQVHQ